jgi:hypothetical protein
MQMKDVKKKVGTIKNKAAAVTTHTKLKKKFKVPHWPSNYLRGFIYHAKKLEHT